MRYIIFLAISLSTITLFSQTNPKDIFENLENGAILVRLRTNQNVLNALKGKNDDLAEKIKHDLKIRNQEVIDAFEKKFTICPTYYFYSYDSKKIANKQFKNIILNKNLEPIAEPPSLNNNYLVATFSETQIDTTTYFMGTQLRQNNETSSLEYKAQYGSPSMALGVDALIILSPELIALQSPYPHYVRTFERLPFIKRSRERTVELLQYKIQKYIKNK